MKKIFAILFTILIFANLLISTTLEERIKNLSKAEMQSIIEFLGDDLLEGRAPGTRGGNLAERYMRSLFKFMKLEPGANGRYLQPFKLKGFTLKKIAVTAANIDLNYPEDVVGTFTTEEKEFQLDADAVFVGFGITTDLWKWDDYKNVDVKDKIVIARVNDPGMYIPNIFEGKVLTYFGRWTYHIEEAARRGAAGILLIHTDESAGYDWNVVKNSWSGEELYLESDLKTNLKFRAWIKESSLRKVLQTKKINLDKLYKKSLKPRFKPVNLGFKIKIKGKNSSRELMNHNVVAEIPGRSKKKIVLSAHIDHLGMHPSKQGDNIFNGAIDNGSAVASMMMVAKILKEFQKDLYYTVVVLACHAEESGLLGSKYYVQNVPDRENIIANINFESTPVWGKASDFMAIGGRFSTLEDMLKTIVEKEGLTYSYFSMVNQGFFYRSDQFSFARYNIPAIWISAGEDDDSEEKKYPRFWKTDYHTVRDEYDPNWELEGLKQTIKMTLLLIEHLNKTKEIPKWKGQLTFPIEGDREIRERRENK
jgi:Zn-dependent M28 family amino/carboxypeptidase